MIKQILAMYILGIAFRGNLVLYFVLWFSVIMDDILQMKMNPYYEGILYIFSVTCYCFIISALVLFLLNFKINMQIFLAAFCVHMLSIFYLYYIDIKGVCIYFLAAEVCWPLCTSFMWLILKLKYYKQQKSQTNL